MSEWFIYLLLSCFSLLLFFVWFKRQGQAAEKKWLVEQISQQQGSDQHAYAQALARIKQTQPNHRITLLVALLIIPLAFAIDALWFQDIPSNERISQPSNAGQTAPDLATAISQLEQKLAANPQDLDGQLLYGRSMMSMKNFAYAVGAYRKANQIAPNDASIMTHLAEAIAFDNNTGSFLGEPAELLEQAIALDPDNQKTMWLYGIVLNERGEYAAAEALWTDLLQSVESPNIKNTLVQQINQARSAQGKPALQAPTTAQTSSSTSTADYQVIVSANGAITSQALSPSARLFVYAKQVDGPPMPIAAMVIQQPFNWPLSLAFSDQNSLNENRLLSSFETVKFSAKISTTGSATPAADDITSDSVTADRNNNLIELKLQR